MPSKPKKASEIGTNDVGLSRKTEKFQEADRLRQEADKKQMESDLARLAIIRKQREEEER